MSTSFVIACPECETQIRATDALVGKRIRCKNCEHVFLVKAPKGKAPAPPPAGKDKPKPPAGKPPGKAPPAPAAPVTNKPAHLIPSDDDGPMNYGVEEEKSTLPRCPFCAGEMPSETAIICLRCGFNTRERSKAELVSVYEPTGGEKFMWMLPAILATLFVIGSIVMIVISSIKMDKWLIGGWFYDDERKSYDIKPGFFVMLIAAPLVFLSFKFGKFAYKRFFINNRPPEQKIRKDND